MRAALLIADISGFTRFMRQPEISRCHAKYIVTRLLKALIAAGRAPLTVAELEGDAVFFYSTHRGQDGLLRSRVSDLFSAFERELDDINKLRTCSCDACDQVVDLKLKQVVHEGEIEVERIDRFEKLFGSDVILVHRMLKNSVPSSEYVLTTRPGYSLLGNLFGLAPEQRKEEFDGFGKVDTFVFYRNEGNRMDERRRLDSTAPLRDKLMWRLRISVDYVLQRLRIKRFRGIFRNLPE